MYKYYPSWQEQDLFKDWIQPVAGKPFLAFCRFCLKEVIANRFVVTQHAWSPKHLEAARLGKKIFELLQPNYSNTGFEVELMTEEYLAEYAPIITIEHVEEESESKEAGVTEALPPVADVKKAIEMPVKDSSDTPAVDIEEIISKKTHIGSITTAVEEYEVTFVEVSEDEVTIEAWSEEEVMPEKEAPAVVEAATPKRTISAHILDTSLGCAVADVEVSLHRLENERWTFVGKAATNGDGRVSQLVEQSRFASGVYKLQFHVRPHFDKQAVKSFYPVIEILIECDQNEHYHIPLLVSPFGYTTYRGT